jgi:menaquinone-dependent protoporphyrinogen oxidase
MIIAVLYATVEGQTEKIASHLAKLIEDHGHQAVLANLAQPGFALPGDFDGAFLCAPIHIGNYPPAFVRFVENWKAELSAIPTALITVSLAIASKNAEEQTEARNFPKLLAQRTGWVANWNHHAAGALKYLQYDFFKRWMLRRISRKEGGPVDTSKDYELTDWSALDEFANGCFDKFARRGGKAA